ncbi:MAG: DNA recombination protein RmuC [Bacteroides sp.]|nr:DNA recombination protein RmuC [Bacteroides sp.]
MEILLFCGGLAIGFVVAWLCFRIKSIKSSEMIRNLELNLEAEKRLGQKNLAELDNKYKILIDEREKSHEKFQKERESHFNDLLNEKESAYRLAESQQKMYMNQSLDALQLRFDETVSKLKAEISTLTSELLKKRQSEFEISSRESVAKIIEPLSENINLMRQAVADNTLRNSEASGRLDANLRMVMEHSDAARKSADRLADALRGGGKIQGDWGETVLTELLESQGLKEGVHFDTQFTLRDASGRALKGTDQSLLRPDVVLHLDKSREIIIDAKVSLSSFLDYMNSESEEARAKALKNHIQSVENHVNELAKKDYASYILPPKTGVDYVIMFVPYSAALHLALSNKPEIWRKAMEKKVYIADEQTLYAALRIIDMTWRQIAQAENHEKVYALANEMLDRVAVFFERFSKIGRQIDDARKSYDDALAKLKDSGQSIPQTCRKLINLGASGKVRKGIDPAIIANSEDDGRSPGLGLQANQDMNQEQL